MRQNSWQTEYLIMLIQERKLKLAYVTQKTKLYPHPTASCPSSCKTAPSVTSFAFCFLEFFTDFQRDITHYKLCLRIKACPFKSPTYSQSRLLKVWRLVVHLKCSFTFHKIPHFAPLSVLNLLPGFLVLFYMMDVFAQHGFYSWTY